MSQPTQLVIFFRCQHKEVTTINADRSSQQNRNFWTRVKKWSSTTPAETTYQHSSSLCRRCREIERKQIEEAADLQARMAAKAARQLAAQGRRLAAPPAQGVGATIAALALPGDNAAIQTLRRAQSEAEDYHELELVDHPDWQGSQALQVQRDLDRIINFWEKHHGEHAGRATQFTSPGGRKFCFECKKIESSLADPVFRRQAGLPDVRLADGVWYGTDGMLEDPWSTITTFGPIRELVSKAPVVEESIQAVPIAHEATAEEASPEITAGPSARRLLARDHLNKLLQELRSPEPVQYFLHPETPPAPQQKSTEDSRLHEHRAEMLKIQIAQMGIMQSARERRAQRANDLPLLESRAITRSPSFGLGEMTSPPGTMANETLPTQSQDRRTEWVKQPLTMLPPDRFNLMRSEIRSLRSLPAGQLALLPLQDEAEIEVLEWYDRHHELVPRLPALPPQDEEELEFLLGLDQEPVVTLPPLPL